MAYTRPTLSELIQRAIGDISARSRGSAFIRRSMERVLAYVHAGGMHGVHGHLDWLYKQMSPVTCDLPMLLVWGLIAQVSRNGAVAATRWATFTGTNGTPLPLDTEMQDDSGAGWTVITGGVVSGGTVTVEVEADDEGSAGNLDAGATLSLVLPLVGIDTDGEVAVSPEGADGSDLEEVEPYRARVLSSLRIPPSGGGPGDYEKWALEVPGVTRAWEFGARMGAGTVSLGFMRDGDATEDPPEDYDPDDIIPSSGEVDDVQERIDARRPIDMLAVYVVAPISVPVDMTIALRPNTAEVQAAVRTQLIEVFKLEAEMEEEMDESDIREAISTAAGEDANDIVTISSLDPGDWGLLTLGTLTFQAL